jgi:peroxiredoxin
MALLESDSDLTRGDSPPAFSLPGADGETHELSEFADHEALLVVFTCNHCPYANARIGTLNGIAADYGDVAVIGINPNDAEEYPDDSFEAMQRIVDEGTVEYDAYLRDESQDIARAYGAVCTPDPFLFVRTHTEGDEDGGFELAYHGRLDDATGPDETPSGESGFEMREAIDRALADESVAEEFRPSRGCSIKWR